jgi:hypothetical protein
MRYWFGLLMRWFFYYVAFQWAVAMTKQVRVQVLIPVWLYEALEVTAKRDLDTISGAGRRAIALGLGVEEPVEKAKTPPPARWRAMPRSFSDFVQRLGKQGNKPGFKPGEVYGHLRVIRCDGRPGSATEVLCQCGCGSMVRMAAKTLRTVTDTCQMPNCTGGRAR